MQVLEQRDARGFLPVTVRERSQQDGHGLGRRSRRRLVVFVGSPQVARRQSLPSRGRAQKDLGRRRGR